MTMTVSRLAALATLALAITHPVSAAAQENPATSVFLHPNGCAYVQSAPQGSQPMWHFLINGHDFFPGARTGNNCPPIVRPVPGARSVY
jgi:hypothetical protein